MESLEKKLHEAALTGNIDLLQSLLNKDPLILDRVSLNYSSETPLHVAAILGHVDFAKEIIRIKPHLTSEVNSQQSTPLHLASGKGHVDIVRALLSVDPDSCTARDKNGLTPLHLAAVKGRVEVLKVLLQAKSDVARFRVYNGETILHLCVRYYQLEALKLLVRAVEGPELVNARDDDGNTVLHLAVADKQVETVDFLTSVCGLEVNAPNLNRMTPSDILIRTKPDPLRDPQIQECLGNGPTPAARNPVQHEHWLEQKRNSLMVVASLIATMAFQVGVNPPSGVWQDDGGPHVAGYAILAHNYPGSYVRFYGVNTTGLVASLSIILLLVSGLPLRRRLFVWALMVMTWVAITAVALAYVFAIFALTPTEQEKSILYVVGWYVIVWAVLMALLLVSHTIRLMVKLSGALRPTRRRVMLVPQAV
ncbi:ankyrin repeat family protein [Striga asiatica]|uniref:Ankyrin repeat family protein n=1 Tax=Striga asiatica TaxID=4170 RepID=A0A5A7PRC1_STRAF|nr:ankyrin repeat family protein [Striga asiatica]